MFKSSLKGTKTITSFRLLLHNLKRNKHSTDLISNKFDLEFLSNPKNLDVINTNINIRKGVGNINLVQELLSKLEKENCEQASNRDVEQLHLELCNLPNFTHPDVKDYGDEPKEVQTHGEKRNFSFKSKGFAELCKKLNILRTEHLGNFNGTKSYYLMNDLAELERALINYTVDSLKKENFNLISVPDILPAEIIEGCGMKTSGERNQIFKILQNNLCLSGTSEMAIAGYFSGKVLNLKKLPIKLMAVSRCYRAETSGLQEEKGIYRVHNFSKVEMFSVCSPDKSNEMLEYFKEVEINIFKNLNLHFKVLDMPPFELGAPAYRKYDIEAWMPGRNMYGEISSCSNCTDYQARRLNITFKDAEKINYVHTINGTACAVPRMLIAILENYQKEDGSIAVPELLQKYMKNKTTITKVKGLPELKLVKTITENY